MNNHSLTVNKARTLARFIQQSEDRKLDIRRAWIERAVLWYEIRNNIQQSKSEKRL